MIDPAEWSTELREIEGFENEEKEIVFDYPKRYGGA
jgi:hypothetical protein